VNPRVLVAGVGNIFLSDDGFGVEVAQRLALRKLPDHVQVKDFGIRGVHLAFELLEGYDTLILVDASPRGEAPGTVYVIEPEIQSVRDSAFDEVRSSPLMDAHGMEPDSVLALLGSLGGQAGRVLVVGCEPANVEEGIGLSPPVSQAVEKAVVLVTELIDEETTQTAASPSRTHDHMGGERGGMG
jgi:hydrogenase maturation protease